MSVLFVHVLVFVRLLKSYELCPLEYYATDPNHSYCLPPFPDVIDQRVNSSERQHILKMHNHERRLVRSTNIEKMYWNDDLAEIALRYARACIFDHDKASQRNVPKIPLATGQNLAMGYENWTQAVGGWIEEKEHYFLGYPSTEIVSHYTQMIWHSAVLVGCAATMCPPYGPYTMPWAFYVCNYITGQLNSNIHRPYDQGVDDKPLHDCQGKVCLYNGTLDLKTCKCQCSTYASGSQCEQLNCSILPPCPYYSSASCIAVNVPPECPRLCGLCDRYEVLKRVYGVNNLLPNTFTIKPTMTSIKSTMTSIKPTMTSIKPMMTSTKQSIKKKPKDRKLKKTKSRNRTRILSPKMFNTTMILSTTNSSNLLLLSIFSYLLHSIIIICNYF